MRGLFNLITALTLGLFCSLGVLFATDAVVYTKRRNENEEVDTSLMMGDESYQPNLQLK